MKVLMTGANGMLGSALSRILKDKGNDVYATDIDTSGQNIEYMDVRDFNRVRTCNKEIQPNIVVHLAAETDVDKCEMDPDHAYLTNTIGTQNVALVCQNTDTLMVYISTIGVFDGNRLEPYTEFDEPNPINVYGRSKLEGEKIVQNLLRKYFIVRAGWMIGGGPGKDKKFVAKIIKQLNQTNRLRAVTDKFGSLTYTKDFSNCLMELIKTKYYGLYHCTNKGVASRYDIAKEIVKLLERTDVTIEPVSSAHFPLPAPRARSEAARNYKLDLLGMNIMRPWQEALKDYVETFWKSMI